MTTTKTTPPAAARHRISSVIWEDGSSFDYENGYSSNGAVREKERTKPVRYSKETRTKNVQYFGIGFLIFGTALLVISLLAAMVYSVFMSVEAGKAADKNNAAIKEYLVKHDGLYVIKMNGENQHRLTNEVIVQDKQGRIAKCEVRAVDNELTANAFLFCGTNPLATTISIPEKVEYHGIFAQK